VWRGRSCRRRKPAEDRAIANGHLWDVQPAGCGLVLERSGLARRSCSEASPPRRHSLAHSLSSCSRGPRPPLAHHAVATPRWAITSPVRCAHGVELGAQIAGPERELPADRLGVAKAAYRFASRPQAAGANRAVGDPQVAYAAIYGRWVPRERAMIGDEPATTAHRRCCRTPRERELPAQVQRRKPHDSVGWREGVVFYVRSHGYGPL